ncbi:50S ribosomal protein L3 [Natranaerofaba carboxydovora]|uniref:50S ribosomal protein L3 n=1 Tax=Natranaerofaba carboxydovora TaxID=2742683 RepID=UPI001F12ED3A|nr:50S ribosomal protein L3 [Natranaerofaba carboxydovora]UMZ75393.1 50S ribosomal protein L3 [Natranaerofaba carboxydovora]
MKKAIMGEKLGMTQIFKEDGELVSVTVIQAGPCPVVQKKTEEYDGYKAVQLGYKKTKNHRVNKPTKGHFDKAGVDYMKHLAEFRLEDADEYEIGQELKVDQFKAGDIVDVTGTSKSKGYQGTVKRFGQSTGPKTHGSRHYRKPGSIGAMGDFRVYKNQKMPGRMGGDTVTVQNLEIVDIDPEKNVILVKGALPGPKRSLVKIVDGVKAETS